MKYFTASCHCLLVHCCVSVCLTGLKCNMETWNTTQVITIASPSITLWHKNCMQKTQTSTGRKMERPHTSSPSGRNDRCHDASTRNHIEPCSLQPITVLTPFTCFVMKQSVLFNTQTSNLFLCKLCTAVNGLFLLIQNVLCWKQTWIHNTKEKITVCIRTLKTYAIQCLTLQP